MCGIAGIVTRRPLPELRNRIERMTASMFHRGPDDGGVAILGRETSYCRLALGSRRLAIIDLSEAGHQPMSNEEKTVWVVYNGETYNFRDLRAELMARGCRFRSRTDTEVLVHGYQEWGIERLLARLRGMFAFAIWDVKAQRLTLARDRLGKKPLYYSSDGEKLVFGSELRGVLASGLIERRLNSAGLIAYLTFGAVPAPLTIIDKVEALPAGCFLTLQHGQVQLKRYWNLSFEEDQTITEEYAVARLRELLAEAVRLRLMSDVPLGVFLSGGIDSGSVVAIAREQTTGMLRSHSLVFQEAEFDEGPAARCVAQRFDTQHLAYEVTAEEVLSELPQMINAMDQPTHDGINTYFVSKAARQSGTVVTLSGLGGDELFGGYPSFRMVPRLQHISSTLAAIPGARAIASVMLGSAPLHPRKGKLRAFLRNPSPELGYLAVRGLFLDAELRQILNEEFAERSMPLFDPVNYLGTMADGTSSDLRNYVSALELKTYMHNQLLRDTDVMSMAHSVEVRTPLLDHELVEFVASVPAKHRFAGKPKGLLLRALGPRLPDEVAERSKVGFAFPLDKWLREKWRPTIEGILENGMAGVLDPRGVSSLWRGFLRGQARWSKVWALVVLQLWTDAFSGRNGSEWTGGEAGRGTVHIGF